MSDLLVPEPDDAPLPPLQPPPGPWAPTPGVVYSELFRLVNGRLEGVPQAEVDAAAPTLDAQKAVRLAQLAAAIDAAGQASFPFDFGDAPTVDDAGEAAGPAGVKHLQMRATAEHDDQGNWKAVMPVALAAIIGGSTSPFPIRVEENLTVLPTAQQVVGCLIAAFSRNSGYVVSVLPALKRAVVLAPDAAALADITWPAA